MSALVSTPTPGAAGPGAPFPQWTVVANSNGTPTTGVIGEVTNAVTKAGLETTAWPSKVLFFTSHQAALNYVNSHGGSPNIPGVYSPTNNSGTVSGIGQGAFNTAGSTVQSTAGILSNIWGALSSRSLWIRIAEGLLGAALITVAIAELGKGTPVGDAVRKVPIIF